MASVGSGTCMLFLAIIIHMSAGADFVKLDCKSENHGQYGEVTILKCDIRLTEEAKDATIMTVTWKKKGNKTALVAFNESELKNEQRFRFLEKNLNGNTRDVSLTVSNTQFDDGGVYECYVMTDRGEDKKEISLNVTAKYSVPIVSSIPEKDIPYNTDVTLVCNSSGGYPEGKIRWFDQEKKEWTGSSHLEAKQMDDGRFILISELSLLKNSVFNHYICSVYNVTGGKDGEMPFDLPFTQTSTGSVVSAKDGAVSKIVAPVLVIGSLIVGLLMALLFKYNRHTGTRNGCHTAVYQGEELTGVQDDTNAEAGENDKLKT